MCGRFTLTSDLTELVDTFPWFEFPLEVSPHYNIAPTLEVLAVPNREGNPVEPFRWGLIPFWAKDANIGNRMINARAETVGEKPAFRNAFSRKRCLILADG